MRDDDRGSPPRGREDGEASAPRPPPTRTGEARASAPRRRRIAAARITALAPAAIVALSWIRRTIWTTWFLGLVLFVITWPVGSLAPVPGLDNSFVAGLHMAAHEHLQFGTQVVGTYGPLGFLRYPVLYYTWTARLSLLYTAGVHLLLCLTVVWALRRMLPTLVAFLLAWVAISIIVAEPESALVVAVVWLVEATRTDSSPRLKRVFPVLAGVASGLEVLIKINTGATVAVLALLVILFSDWREWRRVAAFVGSFVVTFAIAWFAAGQGLANIGPYVSTAKQVISGWSTAMQLVGPNAVLWAALVVAIAVFVIAWQSTMWDRPGARAVILLIWLVLGFSVFKEGFVAQEPGHESIYFGTALGAVIAFSWRGAQRSAVLWGLTLVVAIWFMVNLSSPLQYVDPATSTRDLANQISTMASAGSRDRLVAQSRAAMVAAYGLDATTLAELAGHTVDVVPSEQSILWAYGLKWTPTPVYEWYYSVTPALDELNARVLASRSGPQRLLRSLSAPVNGRNNLFDSPAAQRSMLCNYAPLSTTGVYEVLTRVPNRCGPPRLVRTVRAPWATLVQVPAPTAPDELVFVRVAGVAPHGLESLRSLLWRAHQRARGLKDGQGPVRDYLIVPDTVIDGLTMSVPAAADFPGVFAIDPQATQLALGVFGGSTATLTYRFYEQRIRSVAAPLAG
jgi:hypothetical protein